MVTCSIRSRRQGQGQGQEQEEKIFHLSFFISHLSAAEAWRSYTHSYSLVLTRTHSYSLGGHLLIRLHTNGNCEPVLQMENEK